MARRKIIVARLAKNLFEELITIGDPNPFFYEEWDIVGEGRYIYRIRRRTGVFGLRIVEREIAKNSLYIMS